MESVSSDVYSEEYFLQRCGGIEFFERYKADLLKPLMQLAVKRAALKPGMKILDVGCGRGELVAHLAQRGFDATGIDYSEASIAVAKKFFPKAQYRHGHLSDAALPLHSFDRIFFLGTIEHLYDNENKRTFEQFHDLLKPGGWVVVTTCTNSLYWKVWSYNIRRRLVQGLARVGGQLKAPTPPRSDEDLSMHINEQNLPRLKNYFSKKKWRVSVEPRLNPKLCVSEIYGDSPPPDLPLRSAPRWKQALFSWLIKIPGLRLVITRANVIVLVAI